MTRDAVAPARPGHFPRMAVLDGLSVVVVVSATVPMHLLNYANVQRSNHPGSLLSTRGHVS